ncbi:MAG: heat-shock protein Hsp20 [Candidatus Portnoybacteria bacterium CG_4_10_14_0_2_um_filter_39_11]|uniref:Heat-shock protein Hsp20 n=1 Tax=Candidatus Portnoybacteria bacterium CG_4_10_14_0_2_um_filter_39_11 TaxID=1974797 RepID=A0A2M7UK98_9BACT|nr:MAG: heat-shock protein Hsp20 [Candidatus Portnoybacteria bacterium CG_4_10_14_0_2_um_filter_39_11]
MPNKKPSFFERLTGTLQAADQDSTASKNKIEKPMPSFRPAIEQEEAKVVKAQSAKLECHSEPEKTENWLPDPEGQLAIDVYQTPTDIVIKSTIAGVDSNNLDVSITNDMVTIKGKRENDVATKPDDYYYQECYWGPFSRSIILPTDVLAEEAAAVFRSGILTIRLPKAEKVRTKKIKIETA